VEWFGGSKGHFLPLVDKGQMDTVWVVMVVMCNGRRPWVCGLWKLWLLLCLHFRWLTTASMSQVLLLVDDDQLSVIDRLLHKTGVTRSVLVTFVDTRSMFATHGFMTRFLVAAQFAQRVRREEPILFCFMDDDMLLSTHLYDKLLQHALRDKDAIWGVFGRNLSLDDDGIPIYSTLSPYAETTSCSIALTKCVMIRAAFVPHICDTYMRRQDIFQHMQSSTPKGNGEDILMSWCFQGQCRCLTSDDRWCRYVDLGVLSTLFRKGHQKHRTQLVRLLWACVRHPAQEKTAVGFGSQPGT